jgi:hypothetical protein
VRAAQGARKEVSRQAPLVYAPASIREKALELLPVGAVFERELERAINASNVAACAAGGQRVYALDRSWVARVRRGKARQRRHGARAWYVMELEKLGAVEEPGKGTRLPQDPQTMEERNGEEERDPTTSTRRAPAAEADVG